MMMDGRRGSDAGAVDELARALREAGPRWREAERLVEDALHRNGDGDLRAAVREAKAALAGPRRMKEGRVGGRAEEGIDEPVHTGSGVDRLGRRYAVVRGEHVPVPGGAAKAPASRQSKNRGGGR